MSEYNPAKKSTIALKYNDTPLSDFIYSDTGENQWKFHTIGYPKPLSNVKTIGGELLNGRIFAHKLYSRKNIEVTISADELDEDNGSIEFLRNWWEANYKYISLATYGSYSNYREVITEGGLFPISYIDDIIDLPEITLVLQFAEVK